MEGFPVPGKPFSVGANCVRPHLCKASTIKACHPEERSDVGIRFSPRRGAAGRAVLIGMVRREGRNPHPRWGLG